MRHATVPRDAQRGAMALQQSSCGWCLHFRTRPESSLPLSTDQRALAVRSQVQVGRKEAV